MGLNIYKFGPDYLILRVSTARLQSGSPNEGLYKHSVTGRTTLLLSTK